MRPVMATLSNEVVRLTLTSDVRRHGKKRMGRGAWHPAGPSGSRVRRLWRALRLISPRLGPERDVQPVPAVDGDHHHGEVDERALVEVLAHLLVHMVRNAIAAEL